VKREESSEFVEDDKPVKADDLEVDRVEEGVEGSMLGGEIEEEVWERGWRDCELLEEEDCCWEGGRVEEEEEFPEEAEFKW